ncbi:hypothetical protein BD779DRAFT_1676247 [Infundibulicybe gibba]|nr:hypothetical protein BD779DRAFT_1676247 [Infundibulicybe gibba]
MTQQYAQGEQNQAVASSSNTSTTGPKHSSTIEFHCLIVPGAEGTGMDECCMSGCTICMYDLHNDALKTYSESLARVRASLVAMHAPEAEWLPQLCAGTKTESGAR